MKEIILSSVLFVLGVAALASVISFSAFDVSWWTPIGKDDVARPMVLSMLHAACLIGGGLGLSYLMWRFNDDN